MPETRGYCGPTIVKETSPRFQNKHNYIWDYHNQKSSQNEKNQVCQYPYIATNAEASSKYIREWWTQKINFKIKDANKYRLSHVLSQKINKAKGIERDLQ